MLHLADFQGLGEKQDESTIFDTGAQGQSVTFVGQFIIKKDFPVTNSTVTLLNRNTQIFEVNTDADGYFTIEYPLQPEPQDYQLKLSINIANAFISDFDISLSK